MTEPNLEGRRGQYTRRVAEDLPSRILFPGLTKRFSLRYGINPGNPAAFYVEDGASGPNMSSFSVLQEGKGLGFINLGDMDLGQSLVRVLHAVYSKSAAYCIVKHEMPSAVAVSHNSFYAFNDAWGSDPLSSFGGVHVCSEEIGEAVAEQLVYKARNVEVVCAPWYSKRALEILSQRESLRVVQMSSLDQESIDNGLEYKRVTGGFLVQPRWETRIRSIEDVECVSARQPMEDERQAALFNWIVASFTRSNAVVVGDQYKTHGIGSGQTSRIDAAYMAIRKANGRDDASSGCYGSENTFMASDAFMPSTDVVELVAKSGVTGIIFPLGSIKDKDVIKAADDRNLALLVTRKPGEIDCERAFTHR